MAEGVPISWEYDFNDNVQATVYFDCSSHPVVVGSRVAKFQYRGKAWAIRRLYDGSNHGLFRASVEVLVDTQVMERFLQYHFSRSALTATAYFNAMQWRYNANGSDCMSKKKWHILTKAYFDSLFEFGDFYVPLLDECALCGEGEWDVVICDGTFRLAFNQAKCAVTDVTAPTGQSRDRDSSSRLSRCLQKAPVNPDPFAKEPLVADDLGTIHTFGSILIRLEVDTPVIIRDSGGFRVADCEPVSEFIELLLNEAEVPVSEPRAASNGSSDDQRQLKASTGNQDLLWYGGVILMHLGTQDAVSQTLGVRLCEPGGPLHHVLSAVLQVPDAAPAGDFVASYGTVVVSDVAAVNQLRSQFSAKQPAIEASWGWGWLFSGLLEAVLQRDKQPNHVLEVRRLAVFLHHICLCALRSSPVTYKPSLEGQFLPIPTDAQAATLAAEKKNGADSEERQQYQKVGICAPYAQVRPRPCYGKLDHAKRQQKRDPRPKHGSRKAAKEAKARALRFTAATDTRELDACNHFFSEGARKTGGAMS